MRCISFFSFCVLTGRSFLQCVLRNLINDRNWKALQTLQCIYEKRQYFLYMETYGLWARSDAYGKWAQVAFPGVSFAWKGPCTPINTSQLYFHNIITRMLLLSVLCICDFVVFITMSLHYFAEITFLFCNEIVLLFLFVLCLFVWLLHNNFSMFGWNI